MFAILLAYLAFLTTTLAAPQVSSPVTPTATSAPPPTSVSASPSATSSKVCLSDNFVQPWVLSNVVLGSPPPGSNAWPKFISFAFYDPNEDLVLSATCGGLVDNAGDADLDNGGYLPCDAPAVRFKLQDGDQVLVERRFSDPCVGSPPWDGVTAYAQSDANWKYTFNEAGSMKFQQRMEMNVTRMS